MSALPSAIRGRTSVASALPYSQQISDDTVITYEGDLTSTIRLQGIPFQTMGKDQLDSRSTNWWANLNSMSRDSSVALWAHIVHSRVQYDNEGITYDNPFSTEFARQYADKFNNTSQFVTELFLSPVVRMGATALDRWALKMAKKDGEQLDALRDSARERLRQVNDKLLSDLRGYHPKLLATYDVGDVTCSDLGGFYSRLLNKSRRNIPLRNAELSYQLQSAELHFGYETVEISGAGGSRFAAILGLTVPYSVEAIDAKLFADLLGAKFEFVLSQSLTFTAQQSALKGLKAQLNVINSTSKNELQVKEIKEAITKVENGLLAFGDHEWLLIVYGDNHKQLNAHVNVATSMLDQKALGTARIRGGSLVDAYFSMLPANFKRGRPRAMPITDENFSRLFPLHNHSIGNAQGSQWGMPIAMLKTSAGSPYFFNYHVSRNALLEQGVKLEYDENEDDSKAHRKEVGHYRLIGQTGGGKTVLKLALRALARKTSNRGRTPLKTFSYDLYRGEEIAIRAMGGEYHRIEAGVRSGVNAFSLAPGKESEAFVFKLATWCAQYGDTFKPTPRDEQALATAIRYVYTLDPKSRRFARLLDNIPNDGEMGLYASLGRWCDSGPFAWVLDSPADKFDFKGSCHNFGFDMTSFINLPQARTPLLMYLTHKASLAAAGAPHIIDIAEAWKSLQDPFMASYIEDMAKTLRRRDGVIGLDTQEPADLLKASMSSTLISQFPTLMLLLNSEATEEQYMGGLNLTRSEFDIVKNGRNLLKLEGEGYVLIKKGSESTLAQMDLRGMNDMLAVLSTTDANLDILDEIRKEHGDDPRIWLPIFFQRRV